jgi:hypothetical protein
MCRHREAGGWIVQKVDLPENQAFVIILSPVKRVAPVFAMRIAIFA